MLLCLGEECCYVRVFVQGVSNKAFKQFENGDVDEAIQLAAGLLLPALKALGECVCDEDRRAMESVREVWCQCLVQSSLSEGVWLNCSPN